MFSAANRNNEDNLDQVTAELLKALAASSATQLEGLQQTRNIQVTLGTLLQNEAQRLEKKYGANHTRIEQINSRVQRNTALVKELDVELEIANIRQPNVDSKSALVQGRVADQSSRGIIGLVTYLGDEQGQPLSFLENAETDRSGYYAIQVSPENLRRIRETEPDSVFLGVCTRQGRRVYRQPKAIQLDSGDRPTITVTLSREDLSPVDGGKPTTPPTTDTNRWIVRGQVTNAATGAAIADVQVNAIDNNRRFDDKLGSAITTDKGTFTIVYRFSNVHDSAEQRGPDLYVTVINAKGQQLYSSQENLRQNASRDEQFQISIGSISTDPDGPNRPTTRPNMPLEGSVIWFETRSTTSRQDGDFAGDRLLKLAIRRVQRFLRNNPDGQIALRGYASVEDGDRSEALSISNKRAEVIRGQLIESGVHDNLLTVTAHGISSTYPDVALNQRVEIVLPE